MRTCGPSPPRPPSTANNSSPCAPPLRLPSSLTLFRFVPALRSAILFKTVLGLGLGFDFLGFELGLGLGPATDPALSYAPSQNYMTASYAGKTVGTMNLIITTQSPTAPPKAALQPPSQCNLAVEEEGAEGTPLHALFGAVKPRLA